MTLEHDLLQLARDAMRSLMTGRDFGTGQTGHYLNIISRIEAELSRPKPEPVVSFNDNEEGLWIQLECNGSYYSQNLSESKPARFFVDAYRGRK
jgi:hypothetical protein